MRKASLPQFLRWPWTLAQLWWWAHGMVLQSCYASLVVAASWEPWFFVVIQSPQKTWKTPTKNSTKSSKSKLDWDVWYGIRKHQFLCGCFDEEVYLEALAQSNHGYPWINRSSPLMNDNKKHVIKNCITYFCPFKTLALHVTRIGCCMSRCPADLGNQSWVFVEMWTSWGWGWIQFMSSRLI